MTEFVLRVQCPHHRDRHILDLWVAPGEVPTLWWTNRDNVIPNHLPLDNLPEHAGRMSSRFAAEVPRHAPPIIRQSVGGPTWRGPYPVGRAVFSESTSEWDGIHVYLDETHDNVGRLDELDRVADRPDLYVFPDGAIWDASQHAMYPPNDGDTVSDLTPGIQPHARYEITCPEPHTAGKEYRVTIIRENLIDLLNTLHQHRHQLPALIEVLTTPDQSRSVPFRDAMLWQIGTHSLARDGNLERVPMLSADLTSLLRWFNHWRVAT